jgi:hypothetical protein
MLLNILVAAASHHAGLLLLEPVTGGALKPTRCRSGTHARRIWWSWVEFGAAAGCLHGGTQVGRGSRGSDQKTPWALAPSYGRRRVRSIRQFSAAAFLSNWAQFKM